MNRILFYSVFFVSTAIVFVHYDITQILRFEDNIANPIYHMTKASKTPNRTLGGKTENIRYLIGLLRFPTTM